MKNDEQNRNASCAQFEYRWTSGNQRLSDMSTRSKAAQGRNQNREVLESPGFIRGEDVKFTNILTTTMARVPAKSMWCIWVWVAAHLIAPIAFLTASKKLLLATSYLP